MIKFLIYSIINPMTWLVVGLFFLWYSRNRISRKARRIWMIVISVYFYLCATPFLPQAFISHLERHYPPLEVSALDTSKCYNIISLGGGVGKDTTLPANSLLSYPSLTRLTEAIRVYNLLFCKKLITSGYGEVGTWSMAEVAANAAIDLGVPQTDIDFLPEPKNTEEEAEAYVRRFGKQTPLIISTTAIHIPRAVYIFKKKGVNTVLAAPTDYKNKGPFQFNSLRPFIPRFSNFDDLKGCIHEYVGLWYVQWKK